MYYGTAISSLDFKDGFLKSGMKSWSRHLGLQMASRPDFECFVSVSG